jgi:DNA-binding CsgD family transcriptional regulator
MVQTSQNGSFVARRRTDEADALLIRVHEAETIDKLANALFALVGYLMPYQFCNLLFRPLEFEIPCRYVPAKYKPVVDAYMDHNHKEDLWLERSPVHPGVTVVRHGDFTPPEILHGSAYYRNVLQPLDSEYGASVVAWRGNTWLSTLTLMRNQEQGEFSDAQIEELRAMHPHFECVIRRMAGYQESRLIHSSLRRFISDLPTASVVLDWNLKALHFSAMAAQLCAQWKYGVRASLFKAPKNFQMPGDILAAVERMRPALSKVKATRGNAGRASLRAVHPHPKIGWLSATIEFLPSRTLTLTKGTFLVTLNEDPVSHKGVSVSQKTNQLSPRERECALLAAEGLHNGEIGKRLGKSPITVRNQLSSIFKKLGLDSRHKLIAAFAQADATSRKDLQAKRPPRRSPRG